MDARALAGTAAAIGLAAGIGIGYVAFHSSGKATPAAAPAAATSAATGAAGSASSASDFRLDGKLTLKFVNGSFIWNHGDPNPCTGHEGYDDITQGASVTITDQSGTVIATGSLDAGAATVDSSDHATACVFTFGVPHVPDGRTFYGVAVSHRGIVQFSAEQAKDGQASLSLG